MCPMRPMEWHRIAQDLARCPYRPVNPLKAGSLWPAGGRLRTLAVAPAPAKEKRTGSR